MTNPIRMVAILGPTCSGKTNLAQRIALKFHSEIISVDSCAVYRGMDIGTAKPDKDSRRIVPYHLIDIREPEQGYSVGDFIQDSTEACSKIVARDRIPLLVGGTMMYFKVLFSGKDNSPKVSQEVKEKVRGNIEAWGQETAYRFLESVDPVTAAKTNLGDKQRIGRALEVYEETGKPLSYWRSTKIDDKPSGNMLRIALIPSDKNELRNRIEERLNTMFAQGFLDEVDHLAKKHSKGDAQWMKAVGYKQLLEHVMGQASECEAKLNAFRATCSLAKRQLTWLRSLRNIVCVLDPFSDDIDESISRMVEEFVAS